MAILRINSIILILLLLITEGNAQDTLSFKGQLSAFIHYNKGNDLPWLGGLRYIPQINSGYKWNDNTLFDFEASANISGNASLDPFEKSEFSGNLKPYRLWARYSTSQLELRAGLQKINFGSASLLRPLMWFDQIDARDPLRLTDGVWSLLGRYYFLNNANIWLWGLYGNGNIKGWEAIKSVKSIPEFGGRLQFPLPGGETGFSYHHRVADGTSIPDTLLADARIPENRFGFDAKFDMIVGWWIEASWSRFSGETGTYSNLEAINFGSDYTFGIGNGLTITFEQLLASSDKKPFEFGNLTTFSLLNLSYPVGMFNSLSAIIYYDWTHKKAYNFINWQRQFRNISLYLMAYLNPVEYNIPARGTGDTIFRGNGIQLMLVYNH